MTAELLSDACVRCRKGRVSPVAVDAVYSHEGDAIPFKDEFMRCDNCEREFFTAEQSMARSSAITAAIRKHKGFPSGDEIRAARLGFGLSLPEFERALGVGKNTAGRWERGTVPPSAAANFGLWVAINAPDVFARYAERRGVRIAQARRRETTVGTTVQATRSAPVLKVIPGDLKDGFRGKTKAGPINPQDTPAPIAEASFS